MPSETESVATTAPVLKSIRVRTSQRRAFEVFTSEMDSWWPHTHHIGSSPMTKAVFEGRLGGLCYSEQEDGTKCPWGEVTAWEPPSRFIMAWKITASWQFEPDLAKCSEVEVRFTPCDDGTTLVELEHRNFERMTEGAELMRSQVAQEGGWGGLLVLYQSKAEHETIQQ